MTREEARQNLVASNAKKCRLTAFKFTEWKS